MSTPSKSKNGGGSKKPSPPSAKAVKFFGSEVDIKGKFIFEGPIIYLFDGRSPSRHNQSFII